MVVMGSHSGLLLQRQRLPEKALEHTGSSARSTDREDDKGPITSGIIEEIEGSTEAEILHGTQTLKV